MIDELLNLRLWVQRTSCVVSLSTGFKTKQDGVLPMQLS